MAKVNQNFTMWSGDDQVVRFTVMENGAPVNLTGASVKWQLSIDVGQPALITKATGGSGIAVTDPTNGVFEVTLARTDTDALAGIYYHEAEVTDASGNKSTVSTGYATINADQIQ